MNHKTLVLFICAVMIFSTSQRNNGREECQNYCDALKSCFSIQYNEKTDLCAFIVNDYTDINRINGLESCQKKCDAEKTCYNILYDEKSNYCELKFDNGEGHMNRNNGREQCQKNCDALKFCLSIQYNEKTDLCAFIVNNNADINTLPPQRQKVSMIQTTSSLPTEVPTTFETPKSTPDLNFFAPSMSECEHACNSNILCSYYLYADDTGNCELIPHNLDPTES